MLAAAGVTEIAVHAAPRVTILATGDEVVTPDTKALAPGQVRDALSTSIGVLVCEAGGVPAPAAIIPDDRQRLRDALSDAVARSDCVVTAPSSVGGRDETAAAVAAPRPEICAGPAISRAPTLPSAAAKS
jgi:molybdopterin molybdotransferase